MSALIRRGPNGVLGESEFWGFHASRIETPVDRAKVKASLKKLKVKAAVVTEGKRWLYIHTPHKEVVKFADVVLHYFDHEGSAWDFNVDVAGKRVGRGVFGKNVETGADDQGFTGDLAKTAKALDVDEKKLKKTFAADDKAFFALLGLEPMAAPESEVPPGLAFFDEL